MGLASTIIGTIGVLTIAEGLFVALFPNQSKSLTRKILKSDNFQKIGLIELAIGILLILIAVWLRGY